MMRTLRQCLYIMIIGSALLGCQQGVTDVGNPNITEKPPAASPSMQNPGPALGQLIGEYSFPSLITSSICKFDPQKIPSITSTSDPTQIILNDFLDYGSATDTIVATYDSKSGVISFQIADSNVAIASCSGTATTSNTGISVILKCQVTDGQNPDCQIVYDKE